MMTEPYGANDMMRAWAKNTGSRFMPHASCVNWLSKGRCVCSGICPEGTRKHEWLDHLSGWKGKNGQKFLLIQPYWITDLKDLSDTCDRHKLRAELYGGWYGYGTVCIKLTRIADEPQMGEDKCKPKL